MKTYKFFGTEADIYGVAALRSLGQSVELTDELYRDLALSPGGCLLLPADDFDALGFTAEELSKFGNAHRRAVAPPEFFDKLRAAAIKLAEIKAQVEHEG